VAELNLESCQSSGGVVAVFFFVRPKLATFWLAAGRSTYVGLHISLHSLLRKIALPRSEQVPGTKTMSNNFDFVIMRVCVICLYIDYSEAECVK
jgi:hypothetical protein